MYIYIYIYIFLIKWGAKELLGVSQPSNSLFHSEPSLTVLPSLRRSHAPRKVFVPCCVNCREAFGTWIWPLIGVACRVSNARPASRPTCRSCGFKRWIHHSWSTVDGKGPSCKTWLMPWSDAVHWGSSPCTWMNLLSTTVTWIKVKRSRNGRWANWANWAISDVVSCEGCTKTCGPTFAVSELGMHFRTPSNPAQNRGIKNLYMFPSSIRPLRAVHK